MSPTKTNPLLVPFGIEYGSLLGSFRNPENHSLPLAPSTNRIGGGNPWKSPFMKSEGEETRKMELEDHRRGGIFGLFDLFLQRVSSFLVV